MARAAPADSGRAHFFICIGDQPALDFGGARNPDGQGFAAFGRIVRGMDVVRKIQMSPAKGETLTPPVRILRARVVSRETRERVENPGPFGAAWNVVGGAWKRRD